MRTLFFDSIKTVFHNSSGARMNHLLLAFGIFLLAYLLNIFFITVLYHRALTHESITLKPWVMRFLGVTGVWLTGLEPKAWACMHRLHHKYSDQDSDPHSPTKKGIWSVWYSQYSSYRKIVMGLKNKDSEYTHVVKDIPFDLSFINRNHDFSWLPYLLHTLTAFILVYWGDSWLLAIAYYLGIMSHPIQGWMVNALAHRYGSRRFNTHDDSRNNWWVAFLVFGEGLQNNHHAHPSRANFSFAPKEIDLGYLMCVIAQKLGLATIKKS
jgi:stearoyl-CoA desaturase (delta-9 desaturase)